MGYRNYLYEIPNNLIGELQSCETIEDMNKIYDEHGFAHDEGSYPLFELPYEVFNFGKNFGNCKELQEIGKPLFLSESLQKEYEENAPIIGGDDILLSCIHYQERLISDSYRQLLENDDVDGMRELCKESLDQWRGNFGVTAVNLVKDNPKLARGWAYEYTIFDLVRIYKNYDKDKHTILFFGW